MNITQWNVRRQSAQIVTRQQILKVHLEPISLTCPEDDQWRRGRARAHRKGVIGNQIIEVKYMPLYDFNTVFVTYNKGIREPLLH